MTIPVIDLSGALLPGGHPSLDVAVQIRAAAESAGFFYIIHHGLEPHVVDRQFSLIEQLFDLPAERKEALSTRLSACSRGYEAIGSQTLDSDARPDLKESFYCGIDYPPEHPYVVRKYHTYGMNQWPAELPDLAADSAAYIGSMCRLSVRLMQLIALSLDLPEDYFDQMHGAPMVTLRFLRYPPQPRMPTTGLSAQARIQTGVPSPFWRRTPTAVLRSACPMAAGWQRCLLPEAWS